MCEQDVFLRAGLNLGIADTPERNCKASAKGHSGTICCHQCMCHRECLSDHTVDLTAIMRTKASIKHDKQWIASLPPNQRENEQTRLGVVLDPADQCNPFDKLHFDPTVQMPPESMHQDLRVSACINGSMHSTHSDVTLCVDASMHAPTDRRTRRWFCACTHSNVCVDGSLLLPLCRM